MAPRVGIEPTTIRLTVECSTAELPRTTKPFSSVSASAWLYQFGCSRTDFDYDGRTKVCGPPSAVRQSFDPAPPIAVPARATGLRTVARRHAVVSPDPGPLDASTRHHGAIDR